jgi:hypothetical protein
MPNPNAPTLPDHAHFTRTPSAVGGPDVFILWYAVSTLATEQIPGIMDHSTNSFTADQHGSDMGMGMRSYINVSSVAVSELPTTLEMWESLAIHAAQTVSEALERDAIFPANSEVQGASAMLLNEQFNISLRPGAPPLVMTIPGQPDPHKTVQ